MHGRKGKTNTTDVQDRGSTTSPESPQRGRDCSTGPINVEGPDLEYYSPSGPGPSICCSAAAARGRGESRGVPSLIRAVSSVTFAAVGQANSVRGCALLRSAADKRRESRCAQLADRADKQERGRTRACPACPQLLCTVRCFASSKYCQCWTVLLQIEHLNNARLLSSSL